MRRLAIPLTIILAFLCSGSSYAVAQSGGPGSFLAKKVDSADALVKHVAGNRKVAQRYAKFYRTTPRNVVSYLRSNLKVKALQKPLKTTVYYVGEKTGRIFHKTKVLPAGTRVLVSPDGTPMMDLKCGNPLKLVTLPLPPRHPIVREKPRIETLIPPSATESFVPPPVATPPVVEAPAEPSAAPVVAVPPKPRPSIPLAAKVAPALLAVGAVRNSSGPVPEPGTIAAALSILVPAGIVFRRRRK